MRLPLEAFLFRGQTRRWRLVSSISILPLYMPRLGVGVGAALETPRVGAFSITVCQAWLGEATLGSDVEFSYIVFRLHSAELFRLLERRAAGLCALQVWSLMEELGRRSRQAIVSGPLDQSKPPIRVKPPVSQADSQEVDALCKKIDVDRSRHTINTQLLSATLKSNLEVTTSSRGFSNTSYRYDSASILDGELVFVPPGVPPFQLGMWAAERSVESKREVVPVERMCPTCAPHSCTCSRKCAWTEEELKQVQLPFEQRPWRLRLVCIFFAILGILAAGIIAVAQIGYGVFDRHLRAPPVISGCGEALGNHVQILVRILGISRADLRDLYCPHFRTTMAEAVNISVSETTIAALLGTKESADKEACVDMHVRYHLNRRRSPAVERMLGLVAGLEESIASGSLAEKLYQDWNIKVTAVIQGTPSLIVDGITQSASEGVTGPDESVESVPRAWSCPKHATAPPQATSSDSCTCDPGYYGSNIACSVCPRGVYCPRGSNLQETCPPHAMSPPASKFQTDCVCVAGYYGMPGASCTACEFATFCPGTGERLSCPENSLSTQGSDRSRPEHCTCRPGYFGENGQTCTLCPVGHECPGGNIKRICGPGTFAKSEGSIGCDSCPPASFSGEGAAVCIETECPPNSLRVPDANHTQATSGRDACTCKDPENHFMVDVVLNTGQDWVACRPCALEQCPPGKFLYGCGDAHANSILPNGECFACPQGKYAEADPSCDMRCSGLGRSKCDGCDALRCPPGKLLHGCGGVSRGICSPCPLHTYAETSAPRTECTPCGFLDACKVGQFLAGCGPELRGTCKACAQDAFSKTDGTLWSLEYECTPCDTLTCPLGYLRYGCGTVLSEQTSQPLSSGPGVCLKCSAGKFSPLGTRYDTCAECPSQECAGEPGQVYLDGCVGNFTGVCKVIPCISVDSRRICSIPIQPRLSSAVKIAAGQGILMAGDGAANGGESVFSPSDSDAFGSALAFISFNSTKVSNTESSSKPLFRMLAASAARDASGGSVYVFRVANNVSIPSWPPAVPLHVGGREDMRVTRKLQSSACGLEPTNGQAFGFALASIGDLDGNGVDDLAVSAPYRTSPQYSLRDAGIVCVFLLGLSGGGKAGDVSVLSSTVLSLETMGPAETPEVIALRQFSSQFGCALAALGDANGDGVPDLAATACGVDGASGAVLVLLMSREGHVTSVSETISKASQGLARLSVIAADLVVNDNVHQLGFGFEMAAVGDLDSDGHTELAVSIRSFDAIVLLSLGANGRLKKTCLVRDEHGRVAELPTRAIAAAADVSGDSMPDILLSDNGNLLLLFLTRAGDTDSGCAQMKSLRTLEVAGDSHFKGLISPGNELPGSFFGHALAISSDLNGDLTVDFAVGENGKQDPASFDGAVYIVHLRPREGVSIKM